MTGTTIAQEIELAMAKAFFASAWGDQIEEACKSSLLVGKDIMDAMPTEIDPAATQAARTLLMDMEHANNLDIDAIFASVHVLEQGGDRDVTTSNFGHYAAMQAMGHGVGLHDAFGSQVFESVRVPYVEFGSHSLLKDYGQDA
jgi:hypothetical protein